MWNVKKSIQRIKAMRLKTNHRIGKKKKKLKSQNKMIDLKHVCN